MAAAAESPSKRPRTAGEGEGAEAPVLYSYWRSSCSWRVRIALNLKKIAFDYRAVHLLNGGGEQFRDEYTALNPMKEVPTLCIDGLTLTQSIAIIEYLEESRPDHGAKLLPEDAASRAQVRALTNMIASDTQPVQNLRVLKRFTAEFEAPEVKEAKKLEWGKWAIENGFDGLEKALEKTAGKYSFGDAVTMADLALVPQVYNANRFGVDMSKYPTIARVNAELESLAEFQAAHPSAQPDAVA
jgi:maleylacetoacetate isomerase